MTQPPHDEPTAQSPEELREQIEHTRHELGDTVQALAAKTDVKARAQEKAAEMKEQAAVKAGELKEQAALKAEQVKAKAAEAASRVQDKLPDPVRERAVQAAGQARATTAQGLHKARGNRQLLVAAAAAGTLVWLIRRKKR
ncbi:DUF3618 domain-containing protein [Streptomyces collinus]|uniref:Alanine-rich protein n=1 Tax=Streptomyces collinus (strain DSM 40733 / Tue 365) TaxID=1214242 RepID=S5UND9_STRC3|nr:DUF3618 domain-containing protein [Streptomyces collinus]AGS67291.1 alanine-rich protein [Streptomyces collinus Tu 365]AGS73404.1 alanine-rich protein [Streptomyces collinus Tu 365]